MPVMSQIFSPFSFCHLVSGPASNWQIIRITFIDRAFLLFYSGLMNNFIKVLSILFIPIGSFAADNSIILKSISQNDFKSDGAYLAGIKRAAAHDERNRVTVRAGKAAIEVPPGWYAWMLKPPEGGENLYVDLKPSNFDAGNLTVFLEPKESDKPTPSINQIETNFRQKSGNVSKLVVHGRTWLVRAWKQQEANKQNFIMKTPAIKGVFVSIAQCPGGKDVGTCTEAVMTAFKTLSISESN